VRAIGRALRERDLRLLLSAGLVSVTGDWVLRVGLAYSVYALTGSTLASAVMLLCSFVPQIVLGSVAGVFVDRWSPRRTMVAADLLLAAGLLPLLLVHRPGQVWIGYAVAAWEGCVQQFFDPAEQRLIPRVAGEGHLVAANALVGQNRDVSRLVGSALGGVVAAVGGIALLALVDAASFLVSAGLLLHVRDRPGPGSSLPGGLRRVRAEWIDGLRLSARRRVLRTIMIFLLITSIGEGVMNTLFAPFARSVLHAGAGGYGVIVAA
jgi:Na+/melibiose symporter-like transporter